MSACQHHTSAVVAGRAIGVQQVRCEAGWLNDTVKAWMVWTVEHASCSRYYTTYLLNLELPLYHAWPPTCVRIMQQGAGAIPSDCESEEGRGSSSKSS